MYIAAKNASSLTVRKNTFPNVNETVSSFIRKVVFACLCLEDHQETAAVNQIYSYQSIDFLHSNVYGLTQNFP